ncbi:MAG: hypothetical protein AABY10_02995 [Nanoarchaeota archaeon]
MGQEVCVLPVKCKKCNAIFDLWYDLQEAENGSKRGLVRVLRDSLCWECRREFVSNLMENMRLDENTDSAEWFLSIEKD